MFKKVTMTDSDGGKHEARVIPTGSAGQFKLICTNSEEELGRGEEEVRPTRDGTWRFVSLFGTDPMFVNGDLECELEEQFNNEAVPA